MPAASASILEVAASEDGMKLLRFLERRLAERVPAAALHKWVRSGQVRVNGGRAKPFSRLAAGDLVRLPPFARTRTLNAPPDASVECLDRETGPPSTPANGRPAKPSGREVSASSAPACPPFSPALAPDISAALGQDIRIVAQTVRLLVLGKPAGLPCQPGSGHEDSLSARLASAFAGAPFTPAPAHRIDRHTSGLVAVGLTHQTQRRLHALFAAGLAQKEYLAWVWGRWAPPGPCLLEDRLIKRPANGREGVTALPGGRLLPLPESTESACEARGGDTRAKDTRGSDTRDDNTRTRDTHGGGAASGFAVSTALAVHTLFANELPPSLLCDAKPRDAVCAPPGRGAKPAAAGPPCATLLLLRPLSGRTHQLRVQLASRGFPIIGDGRHRGPLFPRMLLHAFALRLPGDGPEKTSSPLEESPPPAAQWLEFCLSPPWPPPFAPDPALLAPARQRLAGATECFFSGPAAV